MMEIDMINDDVGFPGNCHAETEEMRRQISASLLDQNILSYTDRPCPSSSHGVTYREIGLESCDREELGKYISRILTDAAVAAGADHVVWRIAPEVSRNGDTWRFYARLHVLPAAADEVFWGIIN